MKVVYDERFTKTYTQQQSEIIVVSAGFDRHEADWGRMLTTEDYATIGHLVRRYAQRACQGRRFGVLEGGYNPPGLGDERQVPAGRYVLTG